MNKSLKKWALYGITGAFLIWVLFAPMIAGLLIIEKPNDEADSIVVLAGSTTYVERTQKAAELFGKGRAQRVFLTDDGGRAGWSNKEKRNPPYSDLARDQLAAMNIPSEKIEILPHTGDGTNYEAAYFASIAKENGIRSAMLVTSPYHTRRALWAFENAAKAEGLEIDFGVASPLPGIESPPTFSWWLSSKGWSMVAGEYVKFIYYWLFL